ncbi:MAG TPA: hypothetical protein VIX37_22975 [Candidatus Sulfotelmatobacter sp.]
MALPVVIPPRPSVPTPFVSGTVDIPPDRPVSLLDLIHEQISRNCPGTSTEFQIWPEPTNVAPVWIGAFMQIPGRLSITSFGYILTPMASPRIYRSSYPGTSTVIGVIQVYSQPPAKLHIEVQE